MNARTTIIALVITCALAAAALLVFQGGGRGGGRVGGMGGGGGGTTSVELPQWYQQLSITQVNELEVQHVDGSVTRIAKDANVRSLMLAGWPVEESTADAAMRLISQSVPTPRKAPKSGTLAHAKITLNGQHVLRLHPQSLGGGVEASLDGLDMALECDPRLLSLFEPEAMLAWRTPAAFPFLLQSSSGGPSLEQVKGVSLDAPAKVVQLERRGRAWRVGNLGHGQPETCETLLQALGAIRVSRIIGPPDSVAQNWIESPRVVITVDSDVRQVDASDKQDPTSMQLRTRILRQELRVGGSSDGTGKSLIVQGAGYWVDSADVRTPMYGPIVMVVDSQSVEGLNLNRLGYVAQTPLSPAVVPVADITTLYLGDELSQEQLEKKDAPVLSSPEALQRPGGTMNKVVLRRTLDGWKASDSASAGSHQAPGDESAGKLVNQAAIKALLDVLTTVKPSEKTSEGPNEKASGTAAVQVSETIPAGIKPIGTLVVATSRGPQEVLYMASRDEGSGARQLCIRVAGLYYLFTQEVSEPVLSFIREIMPTQG